MVKTQNYIRIVHQLIPVQKEFDRGKFILYDKLRMNIGRPENKNHDLFLVIDGSGFPFKVRPTNRVSL